LNRSKETNVVNGGHQFDTICPECGQRARFVEVEVSENIGAFFVDLLGATERKYRCSACGSMLDLPNEPEPSLAASLARSAQELERGRAQQERQLEEQKRQRAADAAKANRIEDELAELKKRLGC
jgi:hypothetical protein